jgi:hypothetical protein
MDDGFVGTLRGDLQRRLAALETARVEADRLRRVIDALDGVVPEAPPSPGRVPRGTRPAQLLRVVRAQPGITQRQVAADIGVPATAVYSWVRRAVMKGQIAKEEGRLYPVPEAGTAA